jgi:predicted amidophosphoribosyltransferase
LFRRALDIRELVLMTESVDPAHPSQDRRSVNELARRMQINESLTEPAPKAICTFDDVLTTGAHFKAVEMHLRARFPHAVIAGLFLARRAPEASPI